MKDGGRFLCGMAVAGASALLGWYLMPGAASIWMIGYTTGGLVYIIYRGSV